MSDPLVDRIAEVIREHRWSHTYVSQGQCCTCGFNGNHDAHLAEAVAAVVHPRIETVDDLHALPTHSIVRSEINGHAYEKSMLYTMPGRRWFEAGNSSPERAEDIALLAILLWTPGGDL